MPRFNTNDIAKILSVLYPKYTWDIVDYADIHTGTNYVRITANCDEWSSPSWLTFDYLQMDQMTPEMIRRFANTIIHRGEIHDRTMAIGRKEIHLLEIKHAGDDYNK